MFRAESSPDARRAPSVVARASQRPRAGDRGLIQRRRQRRRLVVAAVVGAAVLAALTVLRPPAPATRDVLVAARAVPAGSTLHSTDLRTVAWPAHLAPDQLAPASALTGRTVIAPLAAGEPVTASRVRSAGTLPHVAGAEVVIALVVQEELLGSAIGVGDRVDVYSADGTPVARAVAVVAISGTPERSGVTGIGATATGRTVLVAAPAGVAEAVTAARSRGPNGTVTVALRPFRPDGSG